MIHLSPKLFLLLPLCCGTSQEQGREENSVSYSHSQIQKGVQIKKG